MNPKYLFTHRTPGITTKISEVLEKKCIKGKDTVRSCLSSPPCIYGYLRGRFFLMLIVFNFINIGKTPPAPLMGNKLPLIQ